MRRVRGSWLAVVGVVAAGASLAAQQPIRGFPADALATQVRQIGRASCRERV